MAQARYESRPIVPALAGAALMTIVGPTIATVVSALLPATGWLRDQPFNFPGYKFLTTIVTNYETGHPLDFIFYGLYSDLQLRAVAALVAGFLGAIIGFTTVRRATPFVDNRQHYDGPALFKRKVARSRVAQAMSNLRSAGEKPMSFAEKIPYPRAWRVLNLLIVGAIGSGKTRLILYLIEQLLSGIKAAPKADDALLIHDTTGEILDGLPLEDDKFAAIHPHKPGGWAWWMGRDLETTDDFEEASDQEAEISAQDPFWGRGSSMIGTGCKATVRGEHGVQWSAPQLYAVAMRSPRKMKSDFKEHYPLAAQMIEFDATGELSKTTVSLLLNFRASLLRRLRPLAEAWAEIPQEHWFSFKNWVLQQGSEQPKVVVVQRSARHPAISSLWIGMVLDAIVNHIGDDRFPVSQTRTRTLVLDELPSLGHLRRLPELLDTGRNKGVCTIATVQDLSQIARIYSSAAAGIKARFRLKIFGAQTPGPDLKTIAEEEIGMHRVIDRLYNKTVTRGSQGRGEQVAEQQNIDRCPITSEAYLANELGVRGGRVKAVVVGFEDAAELTWPLTVWKKRR